MKRLLLSLVALVAMVAGVNAQTEPTYVAKGNVTKVDAYEDPSDEDWYLPTTFPSVEGLRVEVYATDSVVIRNWCGAEGYDLCVTRDATGNATGAYQQINGVSTFNGGGGYYNVSTGLDVHPGMFQSYLAEEGYGEVFSDDTAKAGYMFLYGFTYDSWAFDNGTWTYYYIEWYADETAAIETIPVADVPAANAPVYNLAGQRVGSDYKGVVIQGGKKFIRK